MKKGVVAIMKSYFEMSGYRVPTAYNGAEDLKQAVYQPDIILLYINMPGIDGLTGCEKIREADVIMETRKGVALSYAPAQIAV